MGRPANIERSSYAERVKRALERTPPHRRPTLGQLAESLGISTEHIRKIAIRGLPVVSEELNDRLSRALNLDPREMWAVARREKVQRTIQRIPAGVLPPVDDRMQHLWALLNDDERHRLIQIAEAYVEERQAIALTRARRRRG